MRTISCRQGDRIYPFRYIAIVQNSEGHRWKYTAIKRDTCVKKIASHMSTDRGCTYALFERSQVSETEVLLHIL